MNLAISKVSGNAANADCKHRVFGQFLLDFVTVCRSVANLLKRN
jgi:hypothetical protein